MKKITLIIAFAISILSLNAQTSWDFSDGLQGWIGAAGGTLTHNAGENTATLSWSDGTQPKINITNLSSPVDASTFPILHLLLKTTQKLMR